MSQFSEELLHITRDMVQEYLDQNRPWVDGRPDYTQPSTVTNNNFREWLIGHEVTDEKEIEKFVGDRASYL